MRVDVSNSIKNEGKMSVTLLDEGKFRVVCLPSLADIPALAATMLLESTGTRSTDHSPRVAFLWDADDTLVTPKGQDFRGQAMESTQVLSEVLQSAGKTQQSTPAGDDNTVFDAHHFILSLGSVQDLFVRDHPGNNDGGSAGTLGPFSECFGFTERKKRRSPTHPIVRLPNGACLHLSNGALQGTALPLRGFSLTKENLRSRPPECTSMLVDSSKLQLVESFASSGLYDLVVFADNSLEQCGALVPSYPLLKASELDEMLDSDLAGSKSALQDAVGTELIQTAQRANTSASMAPILVANLWVTDRPQHKVLAGNFSAPLSLRPKLLDFLSAQLQAQYRCIELTSTVVTTHHNDQQVLLLYRHQLGQILKGDDSTFHTAVVVPLSKGLDCKDTESRNSIKAGCRQVQEQLVGAPDFVAVRWNFPELVRLRRLLYAFEKEAPLGVAFPDEWKEELSGLVDTVLTLCARWVE